MGTFQALLAEARDQPTPARAGKLNLWLRERRPRVDPRALADALVRGLEAGDFDRLSDRSGTSCRAAAVGALLELGYPFALEVAPEDLQFFRHATARRRLFTGWSVLGASVALQTGLVGQHLGALHFFPAIDSALQTAALPVTAVQGLSALGAATGLAFFPALRRVRSLPVTLAASAALGLGLAGGGILPALLTSVAALAFLLYARPK